MLGNLNPRGGAPGPVERAAPAPDWSLTALSGRLVELSASHGSAALTFAFGLVLDAQREREPAAWIGTRERSFFPWDAAEGGVDLDALAVVLAPSARDAPRAADKLLRSGAFGLVVVDLGRDASIPAALQSRLTGLAQKHGAAVVVLTEKGDEEPSLGSLVSLRCRARAAPPDAGGSLCRLSALKDKRRGPGWTQEEVCRGPVGLR